MQVFHLCMLSNKTISGIMRVHQKTGCFEMANSDILHVVIYSPFQAAGFTGRDSAVQAGVTPDVSHDLIHTWQHKTVVLLSYAHH